MSLKARDKYGVITYIEDAKRDDIYYCQVCGQPMIQKRGEIRIHHFSHLSSHCQHGEIVPCTDHWHYDMTEWHMNWQKRFSVENIENVLEHNKKKHIADLLISNVVVEFQHSPISLEEFSERNDFYSSLGYKVIWVFDLIEQRNNGKLAEKQYEYYYTWINPKKLFREIDFSKVKATVYFQMSDCEDKDTFVLERVSSIRDDGKWIKTDEKRTFTIAEFVELVKTNNCKLFEKPKPKPAPDSIPGCDTIENLWDESFSSMIVKNKHTGGVIFVFGNNGKLVRDYRSNKIRCRYADLDFETNLYSSKGDYYNVFDENKKIWSLIHSFKDAGYEKRIAKEKEEIENRRKYISAQNEDCYTIFQLIDKNARNILFVDNIYTGKRYCLVFINGYKQFNIFEVDIENSSVVKSGSLNYKLAKLYGYKLWKLVEEPN